MTSFVTNYNQFDYSIKIYVLHINYLNLCALSTNFGRYNSKSGGSSRVVRPGQTEKYTRKKKTGRKGQKIGGIFTTDMRVSLDYRDLESFLFEKTCSNIILPQGIPIKMSHLNWKLLSKILFNFNEWHVSFLMSVLW